MRWLVFALCLLPLRLFASPAFVQGSVGQRALDYRLVVFFAAEAPPAAKREALLKELGGDAPLGVRVVPVAVSALKNSLAQDEGIAARTRSAKAALAIEVRGSATNAWRALEVSTRLADRLARTGGIAIADEVTHQLYAPPSWTEQRVATLVAGRKDIVAHVLSYTATDSATIRTYGMTKLGLPELVLDQVPREREDGLSTAMSFVAQSLFATGGKLTGEVLHLDLRGSPLLDPAPRNGRVGVRFERHGAELEVWAGDPSASSSDRQSALLGALR
jgi:hypothetical protein